MDIRILFFVAVSVGIADAASASIGWNPYVNKNRPSPDRYNYFDAELLEVLTRREEGNVLISPLAVKLVLEMLMEGAVGRSADEIRTALRLTESTRKEQQQEKWSAFQKETSRDVLKIASKIFVSEKYRINPEYQASLKKKFGSDIQQVRFQQPRELTQTVNKWVTNATSGLLTKLTDERSIDPDAKLMLANAVYFKGKWREPFMKENTIIKCFKTQNDDCTNVPMMTESGSYEYAYIDRLDAEAINIPYESDRFSILLVLPRKKNGCRQLSRDMIHVGLDEIISQLRPQDVHVEIPRFTVESSNDLRPYLQKLQILHVFSSNADLSRIFADKKESVLVSKVLHSAKLVVNEEGTEAAAAIGSLFVPLMGGSPTAFIADHPFLFFVRDTETGAVLFSGKIERPEVALREETFTNPLNSFTLQPRQGSATFPGRITTISEAEIRRNPGRQLSSPFLPTSNDRRHVRPPMGKVMKNVRTTNYPDAISFDGPNSRFLYGGY